MLSTEQKNTEVQSDVYIPEPKSPYDIASEVLEEQKGRYPLVVVLGVDSKNIVHINGNVSNFQTLQWLLHKAAFEVHLHEREDLARKLQAEKEKGSE